MSKNRFELDSEKLSTTDEQGHRVFLHPEDVKGPWKERRTLVYWFLIGLYLILPWIYINGKPSLLINIMKREFTFMGFTLYGVEPILMFLVIISALFFIAFMTSLFGRVWCGWGCPQTVFIQSIFLKIETWIEGSARERRALDQAPMSAKKFFKRSAKWFIFTIISLHIAHTFIGYFVGPRELFYITLNSPFDNFGIFTATMILSMILLLDFGWFREQFCIIACPYGRMQSVMMDNNSLVIAYDQKRGEPRRGSPGVTKENEGDCINCYNCVKVCPTGIDIRHGTQLECIACTNCIDACDEIMEKIKKPKGLIRYASENELQGAERKVITPRSLIYVLISTLFIIAFVYFLNQSSEIKALFIRGAETYTMTENLVTNRFTLKLNYQGELNQKVELAVAESTLASKIQIITPVNPIDLTKTHEKKAIVFFKFDPMILESGTKKVHINLISNSDKSILNVMEVTLVGPVR